MLLILLTVVAAVPVIGNDFCESPPEFLPFDHPAPPELLDTGRHPSKTGHDPSMPESDRLGDLPSGCIIPQERMSLSDILRARNIADQALARSQCSSLEKRRQAISDLGRFARLDPRYVAALRRALADGDEELALEAAVNLSELTHEDQELLQAIWHRVRSMGEESQDSFLRELAFREAAPTSAISLLLDLVRGESLLLRVRAVAALGRMGARAAESVPTILRFLTAREKDLRGTAARALGLIGQRRDDVIQALRAGLSDQDRDVREAMARALADLGIDDTRVTEFFFNQLCRTDRTERRRAIVALGRLARVADAPVHGLISALRDADPEIRGDAAVALFGAGVHGEMALPILVRNVRDHDINVQWSALGALSRLAFASAAAREALVRELDRGLSSGRKEIPRFLNALGSAARDVTPALVELLDDPRPEVRRMAVEAVPEEAGTG